MGLNDAQAGAVRATFAHVSELLDDVLKLARDEPSPFDRQRPDLTQAEARRLGSLAAAIRGRMLEALEVLGIPATRPDGSARWSARTALLFGDIALSELSGGELRGYGALDAEDELRVASVVNDVRRLVARAQDLLRGIHPTSVEEAVARVDGPVGEVLGRIWRFARANALVDVYAEIAAVAERAAAPAADVGVFGRTNAGKSSLINALVGQDVLPVGALPVTAIPLRISRGPAVLRMRRERGTDEDLPLEDLSRFTLESVGADETDVVALDALVPTAPEGLRFIDTPGVGSYTTQVGARAFDWLPRCDLGLLLVPAGSVLESEDVALARGLLAAGVELKVFLSKADLLSSSDLEAATGYLRRALAEHLGLGSPGVGSLSVADPYGATLAGLRREVLEPLAVERGRSSPTRLRARLRHLVASLETSFEGRAADALQAGTERQVALERARRRIDQALERLRGAADAALEEAARTLADAWREGKARPEGAVDAALAAPAEATLKDVRAVLERAAGGVDGTASPSPLPMPPMFALDVRAELSCAPPGAIWTTFFPRMAAARRLASARAPLTRAYVGYAQRLRAWSNSSLEVLAQAAAPAPEAGSAAEIASLQGAVEHLADGGVESAP